MVGSNCITYSLGLIRAPRRFFLKNKAVSAINRSASCGLKPRAAKRDFHLSFDMLQITPCASCSYSISSHSMNAPPPPVRSSLIWCKNRTASSASIFPASQGAARRLTSTDSSTGFELRVELLIEPGFEPSPEPPIEPEVVQGVLQGAVPGDVP